MGAASIATPEDIEKAGGERAVFPMTALWSIRKDGFHKCRGCACVNFQEKDPTEQVWTAQAETSSVMAGLRFGRLVMIGKKVVCERSFFVCSSTRNGVCMHSTNKDMGNTWGC